MNKGTMKMIGWMILLLGILAFLFAKDAAGGVRMFSMTCFAVSLALFLCSNRN